MPRYATLCDMISSSSFLHFPLFVADNACIASEPLSNALQRFACFCIALRAAMPCMMQGIAARSPLAMHFCQVATLSPLHPRKQLREWKAAIAERTRWYRATRMDAHINTYATAFPPFLKRNRPPSVQLLPTVQFRDANIVLERRLVQFR